MDDERLEPTPHALLRLSYDAGRRTYWRFIEEPAEAARAFIERRSAASGVGLYATRPIRTGERLIVEAPLATWSVAADATNEEKIRSFEAMAAKLPPHTVQALLQLSQSPRYGPQQNLLGTWQTNGLPINYENAARPGTTSRELASRREAAVFATVCRLNHSCAPNCHAEWNGELGRETVHALVDIPAGQELTICYLPPGGMERARRRAQLLEEHGFECRCARCELTGDELATSEARQRAIGILCRPEESQLGTAEHLQRLNLRLRFMSQEGMPHLWAWKPVLFPLMTVSMEELVRDSSAPNRRRVLDWAGRAWRVVRDGMGEDHPAAKYLSLFVEQIS